MKNGIIILFISLINLSVVFGQDWQTDLAKAKEIANQKNQAIVMVFQGSDWCAPCIKLDREIWSTDAFKSYADDHFVMMQVDFPRRRKNALSKEQANANAQLAEQYNKTGIFPFVVVLDQDGNVLGETSYKKTTPEKYIEELNG
ncbi:MAG: thioredoxin family protein, partial [Saprospiraceae bacterium]